MLQEKLSIKFKLVYNVAKRCVAGASLIMTTLSCNDSTKTNERAIATTKQAETTTDSTSQAPAPTPGVALPPVNNEEREVDRPLLKAGVHPISLHWIGWNKLGKASIKPDTDGWYLISGSQKSSDTDYVKIDGKIRRISAKELEFDGTIETRVSSINGGEPCIRKGLQRFFAKGNRTYWRLQQMENCEGGNLVDYVDIYPGTSSL